MLLVSKDKKHKAFCMHLCIDKFEGRVILLAVQEVTKASIKIQWNSHSVEISALLIHQTKFSE